ncbi:hypothetical protein [Staphylococcus cohnii]|uniref:hypothetical protein n=1 Tax=Staphylococcus cohnii TaxID=29382 RepID=UPI000CD1F656|nr:hypothetical protein [Staphylococcus cohnii]AYX91063.1 hypothetical protein EGX68_12975 [Staphylococcus cohnii]PNZ43480.1 hypothetical protein CD032_09525 [Staphylococcus cohnii subsp. cohnii]GEP87593.1 hypothetical protein SCO01_17830 [Staphylococcus cohnii subsp. cohnii]SUM05507.1 Uncharacterised protein [Staphylococcus cohnii]
MKKLLIALSIIAAVAVIVSAGLFGYSQFKQMNGGNGIQITIKSGKGEKNETSEQSTKENNEKIENQITNEQPVNTEETNNNSNKVTRDNVFDYLFKYLEYEDADTSLITFQEPIEDGNGNFKIAANNKSGSGSYNYEVTPEGVVKDINNAGEVTQETYIELD